MLPRLQPLSTLFRICMLLLIFSTKARTVTPSWRTHFYEPSTVCNTEECLEHGIRLSELIDHSIDPCDDFYQYVCGKWMVKNPRPQYYDEWSVDSQVQMKTFKQIQEMLEEPITKHDRVDMIAAKEFHRECMKIQTYGIFEPSIVKHNVQPIGYFPLFSKHNIRNRDWQSVHNYYLSFTGESGLFSKFLRSDRRNGNRALLCFSEILSPFGLIRGAMLTSDQQRIYLQFLMELVQEVMLSDEQQVSGSDLQNGISAVIAFRMKLYKLKIETMESSGFYHPITVSQMNERYNQLINKKDKTARIDWIDMMYHFFAFNRTRASIENMTINIENKLYFQLLARLLSKTPGDVIANHLHIYFIERHTSLNSYFRSMLMNVVLQNGKLNGNIRYPGDKLAMCILMNGMKETIDRNYVKKYFSPDIKKQSETLVKELKEMLKIQIKESTWLDYSLTKMFVERVNNMKVVIGYPEHYIDSTKRFENPLAAAMQPTKMDAFYLPFSNVLSISAAYVQPPIYSPTLPYAMSYSGLGEYIAHEMYHAFGPHAARVVNHNSQWSSEMIEKYAEKTSCVIKRFDKLLIEELKHIRPYPKIDGRKTLEENLADLMGLKLAYWTFRKKVWETKKCEVLPRMFSFTCDHLFFISFASLYCTNLTTDMYLSYAAVGDHSTARLRVNEATSNFEIFNEIFRCERSHDNSTCDLWK